MKRRVLTGWSVWAVVLAGVWSVQAADPAIRLSVAEGGGVARASEPACGGIPLPAGVYAQDQAFKVVSGGQDVPAQVLPLVVDEKGFLRWVLVDLQTDVPANGKAEFDLVPGRSTAAPAKPLQVVLGADGATVDTGKAVFTISKSKPFSLFSTVTVGGKSVMEGGAASYTDATDKGNVRTFTALAPGSIELFDAGPMRATLKVTGLFDGDADTKMRYIAWITAWAGQSRVHVKYVLANSNSDQLAFRMLDESRIVLKVPGAADAAGPGAVLRAGGLTVHDLHFQEKQPRKLEVKNGELLLRGITPMSEAVGKTPWGSRSVILVDSSHASSQYVVDLAGGDLDARQAADRARLHILAPPAWYSDTEALGVGRFGTQADELACYAAWKWTYDPKKVPVRPGRGMPPLRYIHWMDNHYETEQDTVESLVLMYLRTGARDFFATAEGWADYNMDLQTFRTDGWRFKDGGVWWNSGGPSWGNNIQRAKDPVTELTKTIPNPWTKATAFGKCALSPADLAEFDHMSDSKQCQCHCYGAGLAAWFCITGERDALEAAIDSVEQNHDTQSRGRNVAKVPGKSNDFSRDFTRASYVANAVRLAAPNDPFVRQASDFLAAVYVQRPEPEPRGLVTPLSGVDDKSKKGSIAYLTSDKGGEKMKELGLELKGGQLHQPASGRTWRMVVCPASWMFIYQSWALDCRYRATGDEDAMDRAIAYGQAAARVLFQSKHSNLDYEGMLVDFPTRGFSWDRASWALPEGAVNGQGVPISGNLARYHGDICARAYSLCGDPLLKQRAYDYWWGGSHRGYNALQMSDPKAVSMWVNTDGVHDETVIKSARTFYEWSHPRKDEAPPKAVTDMAVTLGGGASTSRTVTVSFTAPADEGGGRVVRYQVKCSDRPIVAYEKFLELYNDFKDDTVCNWFLARNLDGEPGVGSQARIAPKASGQKESFTVSGVPAGAKYFAVRAFDDASNRSAISNVAEAR